MMSLDELKRKAETATDPVDRYRAWIELAERLAWDHPERREEASFAVEQAMKLEAEGVIPARTVAGHTIGKVLELTERWDLALEWLLRRIEWETNPSLRGAALVNLARLCRNRLNDPVRAAELMTRAEQEYQRAKG